MLRRYRQSIPARITAAGFILILVFGNLWLAQAMTGTPAPDWVLVGFYAGMLTAILGGLSLAGLALTDKLRDQGPPSDDA